MKKVLGVLVAGFLVTGCGDPTLLVEGTDAYRTQMYKMKRECADSYQRYNAAVTEMESLRSVLDSYKRQGLVASMQTEVDALNNQIATITNSGDFLDYPICKQGFADSRNVTFGG